MSGIFLVCASVLFVEHKSDIREQRLRPCVGTAFLVKIERGIGSSAKEKLQKKIRKRELLSTIEKEQEELLQLEEHESYSSLGIVEQKGAIGGKTRRDERMTIGLKRRERNQVRII